MPLIRKRVVQGDLATIIGTASRSNGEVDDLTDAETVMFTMRRVGDDTATVSDDAILISPLTSGKMQYTFQEGDTDIAGDYNLSFYADFGDRTVTYPLDGVLRIDPDLTIDDEDSEIVLTYASVEDYRDFFPSEDIDAMSLLAAELVVSGVYNCNAAAYPSFSAQDKYHLSLGTCLQARWMSGQPGYFTQSNLTNISTQGMNASFAKDGLLLSPVARAVLKNLSWTGSRSILDADMYASGYNGLRDIPESSKAWQPLKVKGWRDYGRVSGKY